MSTLENLTEPEVRALRDRVYGRTGDPVRDEKNWSASRDHWLRPENVAWLLAQSQNKEAI